jgi:hypothetical protein
VKRLTQHPILRMKDKLIPLRLNELLCRGRS